MVTAIDCQSFGGGFTLGMARAGVDVVAKRENIGGFGVPIVDYNRNLINPDLDIQVSAPEEWRPKKVQVVFGNPPCSGFSGYSGLSNQTGSTIGRDHAINECMWDLVRFAASCKADIVIMESVQAAFRQGRDLMQELRFEMEERTGRPYDLIHVPHNNASITGGSIRKRYFMVLARPGLKFGIEPPDVGEVTILDDLIGDLEPLRLTRDPQKYRRKPKSAYAASLRSSSGLVDGHDIIHNRENDALRWVAEHDPGWKAGEYVGHAMQRILERLAGDWSSIPNHLISRDDPAQIRRSFLATHAYRQRRANGRKMAGVISGTGCEDTVHPNLPRPLTFREGARILGFPDDWSLWPILESEKPSHVWNRQKWIGKGISVGVGEWIGGWAIRALERNPGTWRGTKLGDRAEWVIDTTHDHKAVYNERTGEKGVDSRSRDLLKAQARRLEERVA